jgi:hypothetical protein
MLLEPFSARHVKNNTFLMIISYVLAVIDFVMDVQDLLSLIVLSVNGLL